MFDIAWSELMLIGAVALVVIGPKDLPKAMRTVGQAVGKIRRMAGEFQGQFNDAMREAELHDLKKQVEDVGGSVSSAMNSDYKPIEMPKDDFGITDPPTSTVSAGLDDAAMKEAEVKLAALPGPEPLPEIVIDPAPVAEPKPARRRAAKAEATQADTAPPSVDTELPETKPRRRKAKVSEPDDGSAA
jgi:sec-independent protein translocase protein TatB